MLNSKQKPAPRVLTPLRTNMAASATRHAASPKIEPASTPAEAATPSGATPVFNVQTAVAHDLNGFVQELTSRDTSFGRRNELWAKAKEEKQLDKVLGELEARMEADPKSADVPAVLGQGYLQKAGSSSNVVDQGICGLKADQVLDKALSNDPTHWEARFWKACAMSYWPAQLGKSREVMQHFVTLIEQQEALPPQPEFVQCYSMLGDVYLREGYDQYANDIWQRGLMVFPGNQDLQRRIAERASR
jgi:hypothetical protein